VQRFLACDLLRIVRPVSLTLVRTFASQASRARGDNVVLSQGGQSVRERGRYAMASVGAEIKDPQTAESLGRIETPCCEVVVDRVTPKVSHGHLENVHVPLDGVRTGGLQLRLRVKAWGRAVECAARQRHRYPQR
jgi:hypothetical protein